MKRPVIIIGIGEIGGVFARGLLRTGHPVYPVTRAMRAYEVAVAVPEPELALVATAENDLHPTLADLPDVWHDRVGLLQNELLPRDWERHELRNPTVISVWFEKKPGSDPKPIIPSPVLGPHAGLLAEALAALQIPSRILADEQQLLHELVLKNVYILTTNIAGLVTRGSVGDLWLRHQELARAVADEVMDIQASLIGAEPNRPALLDGMLEAFRGDPEHRCMGRSAPARLARALQLADAAGLAVPRLREIHSRQT